MLLIRQETDSDLDAVYTLIQTAFATSEHSDGTEQDLVVALRSSDAFIPELALVAVADAKIVGYIMFTKASAGGQTLLVLAPLAVLPDYQQHGIGSALIREGHRIAKELGYGYISVLGSDTYYPRFGYQPAVVRRPSICQRVRPVTCSAGLKDKSDRKEECFMFKYGKSEIAADREVCVN